MTFLLLYWKYIAVVLLLATAYYFIDHGGYSRAESKYQLIIANKDLAANKAREVAKEKVKEKELLMNQVAMNEALIEAQKSRKREIEYKEIIKEVITYAESPDAGKCSLPNEFVRRHSNAVRGSRVPEDTTASGRANAGARRFTDVDVLKVDTFNYATCNKWKDQLIQWQNYYTKVVRIQ